MSDDHTHEGAELTFDDICKACDLPATTVTIYIEEGLIEVEGGDVAHWRFTETALVHIRKARRLERDLRLNPAGSVLVLELMGEIDDLKKQLRRYQRQEP